jgi:hypothetical protein
MPSRMLMMDQNRLPWFFKLSLFLCLILAIAGWGSPLGVRLVFESARLQGLTLFLWIVLAWSCLLMGVKYCSLWMKFALPGIFVVPLLFVTMFGLPEAEELVKTNRDTTISVAQRTAIDSRTFRIMYDYNPGPMCWGGLMERTELSLMPGILLIYDCHKVTN